MSRLDVFNIDNPLSAAASLNYCLICFQALAVDPIPRTIQQIVRQGVSLCDDWQDLVKYLSFYFKNKRNAGDKNKKGTGRLLTSDWFLILFISAFCRPCNNLYQTKEGGGDSCGSRSKLTASVADPGSLSRIPDPDFYPSRISDPGSKNSNKRDRWK